ncbi:MAG: UPF0175 family protein [Cyanobacteria bacterium J06639_16]
MHITLTLPDHLTQTDTFNQADWLKEIAVALYKQNHLTIDQAAQLAQMSTPELQKLLIPETNSHPELAKTDSDNEPEELVLDSLNRSLQQAQDGKVYPIAKLWDGIDV